MLNLLVFHGQTQHISDPRRKRCTVNNLSDLKARNRALDPNEVSTARTVGVSSYTTWSKRTIKEADKAVTEDDDDENDEDEGDDDKGNEDKARDDLGFGLYYPYTMADSHKTSSTAKDMELQPALLLQVPKFNNVKKRRCKSGKPLKLGVAISKAVRQGPGICCRTAGWDPSRSLFLVNPARASGTGYRLSIQRKPKNRRNSRCAYCPPSGWRPSRSAVT